MFLLYLEIPVIPMIPVEMNNDTELEMVGNDGREKDTGVKKWKKEQKQSYSVHSKSYICA